MKANLDRHKRKSRRAERQIMQRNEIKGWQTNLDSMKGDDYKGNTKSARVSDREEGGRKSDLEAIKRAGR